MTIRTYMLGLVASIALGVSGAANAFVIIAGDIKISLDFFAQGTVGYNIGGDLAGNGLACTTVAECDANAFLPAADGYGSEDSWGIFSISAISLLSDGSDLYVRSPGDYLVGIFYGLEDFRVRLTNNEDVSETLAFMQGGEMLIYSSATNYTPNLGASARTAIDEYPGIDGSLWLSAQFVTGISQLQPNATYRTTFSGDSLTGTGSGYLAVTGGSFQANLDTNGFLDGAADLLLETSYNAFNIDPNSGWSVAGTGDVRANLIPTPGTLALMGLALAGLGFSRRLRRN